MGCLCLVCVYIISCFPLVSKLRFSVGLIPKGKTKSFKDEEILNLLKSYLESSTSRYMQLVRNFSSNGGS